MIKCFINDQPLPHIFTSWNCSTWGTSAVLNCEPCSSLTDFRRNRIKPSLAAIICLFVCFLNTISDFEIFFRELGKILIRPPEAYTQGRSGLTGTMHQHQTPSTTQCQHQHCGNTYTYLQFREPEHDLGHGPKSPLLIPEVSIFYRHHS